MYYREVRSDVLEPAALGSTRYLLLACGHTIARSGSAAIPRKANCPECRAREERSAVKKP